MLRWCLLAVALFIAACAFVAHAWFGPIAGYRTLLVLLALFEVAGVVAWSRLRRFVDAGPRPAGVPRRYGVGSILIVTAVMAMFLSTLQWLGGGPLDMGLGAAYFAAVGVGQAVLFGGKAPRRASALVGVLFPMIVGCTAALWKLIPPVTLMYLGFPRVGVGGQCVIVVGTSIILGAPAGYIAGSLVATIFLVIERVWGRLEERDEG